MSYLVTLMRFNPNSSRNWNIGGKNYFCNLADILLSSHFVAEFYMGPVNRDVKVSVLYFWKFALPPFSPPLPSVVDVSKQNRHQTFDPINNLTSVENTELFSGTSHQAY